MPDPVDPTPPPPPSEPEPSSASPLSGNVTSTGLLSNVAAALACIPLFGGPVLFVLEKRDEFVRFYAMQSIFFSVIWFLFYCVHQGVKLIFESVPVVGPFLTLLWVLLALLVHLVFLIIWVIMTVKAFTNVRWEIPFIGPIARKQLGETDD